MKYKVPHEKQQKQVDKEKNKKTGKNEDEMKRKVTHSQNENKTKKRQIINKKNKTAMTFRDQIHSPHQAAKTKRIFHHNIQAVFPFG